MIGKLTVKFEPETALVVPDGARVHWLFWALWPALIAPDHVIAGVIDKPVSIRDAIVFDEASAGRIDGAVHQDIGKTDVGAAIRIAVDSRESRRGSGS